MSVGPIPLPPPKLTVDPDLQKQIDQNHDKLIADAKSGASQEVLQADVARQVALQAQATPNSSGADELDRLKHLDSSKDKRVSKDQRLSKDQQASVMQAWDTVFKGEKHLGSLPDLAKLAQAHLFTDSAALDLDAVVGAKTMDALKASSPEDADKLVRLTSSDAPEWGAQVRDTFSALTTSKKYLKASPSDQAKQISQFIKDEPWLTEIDPGNTDTGQRNSARVPVDVKTFPVSDKGKAAQVQYYMMTVHSHDGDVRIPVTISTKDPQNTLSLDQVTKGLAQLPYVNLKALQSVSVEPDNTFNAFASFEAGTFTFKGAATSQNAIDRVTLHESSHVVEGRLTYAKDLPGGPIDDQWKDAIKKDGMSVSKYGETDSFEGYAEASRRYIEVKGTPDEAAARVMYPAEFALLDRIYDGDLKKSALTPVQIATSPSNISNVLSGGGSASPSFGATGQLPTGGGDTSKSGLGAVGQLLGGDGTSSNSGLGAMGQLLGGGSGSSKDGDPLAKSEDLLNKIQKGGA